MSEYWKSTPKYWCKFCEVYVRDTKLDKQQHEATGRHQGGIQRNLRELHKRQVQEDRENAANQRELDRIQAKVTGKPVPRSTPTAAPVEATATFADRKRQMEQLAAMGVAVPEEFRAEMAMTGDWQTTSYTRLNRDTDADEPAYSGAIQGVHKRKAEDDEDAEAEAEAEAVSGKARKGAWGSRIRTMKTDTNESFDFDQLLNDGQAKKEEFSPEIKAEVEIDIQGEKDASISEPVKQESSDKPTVKEEDSETKSMIPPSTDNVGAKAHVEDAPVVFKKRKGRTNKT